jgi:DNA-binding NarL/FixJ family response regulator
MTDVLIISALATVRAGLRALLGQTDDLVVVGEGRSLDPTGLADQLADVDLVLYDAPSGEDLAALAGQLDGAAPGLVILGPPDAAVQVRDLDLAVPWAYLRTDAGAERIVAAARAVTAGLVVLDADLAGNLLRDVAESEVVPLVSTADDLTARELEVLSLVALGLTNKAIAQRLGISDHTVKFHVAAVLTRLNAESRTEAVNIAYRRGLLTV